MMAWRERRSPITVLARPSRSWLDAKLPQVQYESHTRHHRVQLADMIYQMAISSSFEVKLL